MAITLLDELALEKNVLRSGIIESMLEQVQVTDRIPWETTEALSMTVTRLSNIPRVPMRMINEVPSQVKVSHTQSQETLYIMDTDIDIDPVLLMSKNTIMSLEVAQTKGVTAALGYQINDMFINSDTTSDPRQPQGLAVRLRDDSRFAQGTINATANSTKQAFQIDASDADMLLGLNAIERMHMFALRGKTSAFISNQQFMLNFWAVLRKLKLLDITKDQFDREIGRFHGVPILDIGYQPESAISGTPDSAQVNRVAQIIGYDSDDYDAGFPGPGNGANAYQNTNTVYGVVWGENELVGLQEAPLRVKPIGETQEPPHFVRTNLLWVLNPCVPLGVRSVARLAGLQLSH